MDLPQNNLKRSWCSVQKLCSAGKHHGLLGDKAAFSFPLLTNYASISAKFEKNIQMWEFKRLINSACKVVNVNSVLKDA